MNRSSILKRFSLQRFIAARGGNVAMLFGLLAPVMLFVVFAAVDLHRITTVKANVQDALDSAALTAARTNYVDEASLTRVGLATLRANMKNYAHVDLHEDQTRFSIDSNRIVIAEASVSIRTMVAGIFLPPYGQALNQVVPVTVRSEVNRSSRNVEVALVLDITGSMDNCTRNCPPTTKIADLRAAAADLVDLVVQEDQSLFWSKVALAPYSMGVNVGSHADAVRGPIDTSGASVSSVSWITGTIATVSAITRSGTATVTANGHGFANGDRVVMWNVRGMTSLNGRTFVVANRNANTYQLRTTSGATVSTSGLSSFSGSAYVARCVRTDCGAAITAANHRLAAGGTAYVTGLRGVTQLNNKGYEVISVSSTGVVLDPSYVADMENAGKGGLPSGSGGTIYNGADGYQHRVFRNMDGLTIMQGASTCVSERVGSARYTDAAPTGSNRVGRNYPSASNRCPTAQIVPLTSVKKTLKDEIRNLDAVGSTAGHIGLAWGWYLVSPDFGVWSGMGAPGRYKPDETLKVVVLMTDGEFNTPYYRGVISANAGDGSGATSTHINVNSDNGSSFAQAAQLCDAMKRRNVVIYTVGFDIPAIRDTTPNVVDTAAELMRVCATSTDHAHTAASGSDLRDAFQAIGRDITRLRISG